MMAEKEPFAQRQDVGIGHNVDARDSEDIGRDNVRSDLLDVGRSAANIQDVALAAIRQQLVLEVAI